MIVFMHFSHETALNISCYGHSDHSFGKNSSDTKVAKTNYFKVWYYSVILLGVLEAIVALIMTSENNVMFIIYSLMSKSSPMTISHRCLSVVPWISGNAKEGSDMFRMLGHPRGVRWTSCAMWEFHQNKKIHSCRNFKF